MKTCRKRSFTLVELLVSIVLLSLMTVFMLRFFDGSQKLWRSGDNDAALQQNSHAALDLISGLVTTVQFTAGEKTVSGVLKRDRTMDSIFSLDNSNTNDYGDANRIYFACKTVSNLPKKSNNIRFVSFQLGAPDSGYARGKLFMLVYADTRDEARFSSLFPRYDSTPAQGNRDHALASLKSWLALPSAESGENEYAQVVAENVVGFKIEAFKLTDAGATTSVSGSDVNEPPYLLNIRLTLLGKEDFATFSTLNDSTARTEFLAKNARIFTRGVFIGDRLALDKVRLSE